MKFHPAFYAGITALLFYARTSSGQAADIPPTPVPENIAAAEYFLDNDPGFGSGISLPVTAGNVISLGEVIATLNLSPGVHYLHTRVRTAGGSWSLSPYRLLYVVAAYLTINAGGALPDITQAEYFFDTDPGQGNGQPLPVTSGQQITLTGVALDITGLANGSHRLFVRGKNQPGYWSHTASYVLHIVDQSVTFWPTPPAAPIVKAEYFFDTDPGFGNGTDMPVTAGTNINFSGLTGISTLPEGTHKYFVRLKDQQGNWSLSNVSLLSIVNVSVNIAATPVAASFSLLEYFVDTDPGEGNGTIVPLAATQQLSNYTLTAAIPGLADGQHRLFVRTLGSRSQASYHDFYVGIPLPVAIKSFGVRKEGIDGIISWETAAIYKPLYYEVQRSTDGKNFSTIKTVPVQQHSGKEGSYEVKDANIDALQVAQVYYRIRSVEQDATGIYTGVLSLRLDAAEAFYAYAFPNPAKDQVHIQYYTGKPAGTELQMSDISGKVVLQRRDLTGNHVILDMSRYAPGIYYLQLSSGDWKRSLKLMKQ